MAPWRPDERCNRQYSLFLNITKKVCYENTIKYLQKDLQARGPLKLRTKCCFVIGFKCCQKNKIYYIGNFHIVCWYNVTLQIVVRVFMKVCLWNDLTALQMQLKY